MQYMLLIYEDEAAYGEDGNNAAMHAIIQKHMAFSAEHGDAIKAGAGLQPTPMATTVRTHGADKSVHDGPFAETREQLGGFYLIEAADLDAAMAIARKLPLHGNGAVEIRPALGM